MKFFALLLLAGSISCAVLTRPSRRRVAKAAAAGGVDPRKLFLTFTWNAREQRYQQQVAMREEFQKQLKAMMEKYQFDQHLDLFNHQTLEDVHRQYLKTKNGVNLSKNFLVEKMDSIYNNFIQPARWFY